MYKLSPSDFAYLYEECKLCYYLKVKHGIEKPKSIMPAVFTAINTRLQTPLVGQDWRLVSPDLPEGTVVKQEGFVTSKAVPGTDIYIRGKYDLLVERPDGTFILVDLKISKPDEDKIEKYKTQLGAYKFALENPADDVAIRITKIGLLVFYPDTVTFEDGEAIFHFPPKWLEVPIDDVGFLKFAKEVDDLLSDPVPKEGENCKWCEYRHLGDKLAHEKL